MDLSNENIVAMETNKNFFILHNKTNLVSLPYRDVDLIYADCIYESLDFLWVKHYWDMLKENGVMIVQTDYHSVAQLKLYMDELPNSNFVNWVIYVQRWGGVPKKGFPQKHDDILIYSKGKNFHWDASEIQIPKATAGTAFDKKGTGKKTPDSVFEDLGNFSTMSNERIKNSDGHNIRWQKPMKLMNRLLTPFLKENDLVVDPFMGSGTTGEWCVTNNMNFIGIEIDNEVYNIAVKRIEESIDKK